MSSLHFAKISQFRREQEPVTVSIPFARGALVNPDHLTLRDGEARLPAQRHILARWDDQSVKWLLVHAQPDLPGNDEKTLQFSVEDAPPALPAQSVSVTEIAGGLRVDTGPLSFTVPTEGFWPVQDVTLNGQALWSRAFQGFTLAGADAEPLSTAAGPVELTVEASGPLCAVIRVAGQHRRADGSGYVAFRGRIIAFAGKPYIQVEHQFLHTEQADAFDLEALSLAFAPEAIEDQPRLALGEGFYRTHIQEGEQALEMAITAETLLYQANEHFIDSYYGDFWVDWRDARGGLTLSIHQAHQNFPKKLQVNADGITCWLYPDDAPPAPVLQGMAKTHRMQLHFHAADTPLDACSVRSLQFQLPDHPTLSPIWYQENNPWLETFFPAQLPLRLFTLFNTLHDGRPKALGMMHFGDAPDAHYTNQGRGSGETVWVNNEYDRPHCCILYYALSGQRRVLDSGLANARHWLDVDFCHYHPDPLIHGGLRIHTRYHATGKATPSHEWTEGFLDYYFFTGRQEGLDAAISVGENILRHLAQPEMQRPGATSVRESGWALRAMVGLYLGTGDDRWKAEAGRIVAMFLAWYEEFNALLAPYTSHTMPRVPFMIALTVNSFARYLLIEDDERVKRLIVEVIDDLLAHCLGPDGIFFYKELPSLERTAPTPHVLEALTHAYRITGQEEYLKVAARQFAALAASITDGAGNQKYIDASGAVIAGRGGGRIFADKYLSLLLFAAEAAPKGFLDWYDYPY